MPGGAEFEFLPLCDVLFNVISLAEYFCHLVFDFLFFVACLSRGNSLALVILAIILSSLIVSQVRVVHLIDSFYTLNAIVNPYRSSH